MKKNIILSIVAVLLLVGGVILIAPMFSSNPGGETVSNGSGGTGDGAMSASGDGGESVFDRYADRPVATGDKPSAESIVTTMASDEYAKMSPSGQRAYRATIVEAYSDPREAPDMEAMGRGMQAMQSVPEEKREAVQENMRTMWREVMAKRYENFFTLDKDEQMSSVDERIDREVEQEERVKAWMAENADSEHVKRMKARAAGTGTGSAHSVEHVERGMQWRQAMSSPATRARRSQYDSMVDERRTERGIAPSSFGGWRGRH